MPRKNNEYWMIKLKHPSEIYPFSLVNIDSKIKNISKKKIRIHGIYLKPGWSNKFHIKSCNISLNPKEETEMPKMTFEVPADAKLKNYNFKIGVSFQVFEDEKWANKKNLFAKEDFCMLVKKGPELGFKIFISHSNNESDIKFLKKIHKILTNCGFYVYYSEKSPETKRLWDKIRDKIEESNSFLIIWSKDASKSFSVAVEIGHISAFKKLNRTVILSELKSLKGPIKAREFIRFDRRSKNNTPILEAVACFIELFVEETEV